MGSRRSRAAGRRRTSASSARRSRVGPLVGGLGLVVAVFAASLLLLDDPAGGGAPRPVEGNAPRPAESSAAGDDDESRRTLAPIATRVEPPGRAGAASLPELPTAADAAAAAQPLDAPESVDTSLEPRELVVTPRDPFGDRLRHAYVNWRHPEDPPGQYRRWRGWHDWDPSVSRTVELRARLPGWGRVDDVVHWGTWDGEPLQLVLGAGVEHWGVLRDRADRPLVDQTVQLLARGRTQPLPPVRTGAGGRLPLRVHPEHVVGGRMLASFEWQGSEATELVPLEVVDDNPLVLRRAELSRHVFVLVDDAGRPLLDEFAPGRRRDVMVLADPPSQSGPVVVDPGARALVLLTGEGPATLRLVTDVHRSAPVRVERVPGADAPLLAVPLLETGGYTGSVRDEQGRPLAGAWVALLGEPDELHALGWPTTLDTRAAPPEPPPGVVTSSADGRFFGLPHAAGTLLVLHPGFRPLELPLGGVADDLSFVLDPGLRLELRLPADVPVDAEPELRVELACEPPPGDPVRVRRAAFDASGRAHVAGLPPGRHVLRLLHDDQLLGVDEVVLPDLVGGVDAVERVVRHTLQLAPVARVRVQVAARHGVEAVRITPADPEAGRPVMAALQTRAADPPGAPDAGTRRAVLHVPWSGPADLDVRRHVSGVPPERVGWQTWGRIQVAAARDVVRELSPPAGRVRIGLALPPDRAPYRVELVDPLDAGAPLLATARFERADTVREFSGLAPGFYRVDVTEADDPVRPGGAFVGQVTAAVTEAAPAVVQVTAHDGERAMLAVRVVDAEGRPRRDLEVLAGLTTARFGRGRTNRDGKARIDVPAGVRGSVTVRDLRGHELARVAYQGPGRRLVLVELGGGDADATRATGR